jgi:hypothetical protein
MPMRDVRRTWGRGLAAAAFGSGRAAPLDHLGPHNALEWLVYLALLAIFAAVVVHEWRNRNAIPGFRQPRRRKTRPDPAVTHPDPAAKPLSQSPVVGSAEPSGDPGPDPERT